MRSWHSEQIEAEVRGLPAAIRKLVFEMLEPVRRQRLLEMAKIEDARRRELKRWQHEAKKAKDQVVSLQVQLDAATKKMRLGKEMDRLEVE